MADDNRSSNIRIDEEGVYHIAGDPGGTPILDLLDELPPQPAGDPQERRERIKAAMTDEQKQRFEQVAATFAEQQELLQRAAGRLAGSFTFDFSNITGKIKPALERLKPLFDLYDEIEELKPYLQEELSRPEYEEALLFMQQELKDPEYKDLCIEDIIDFEFPTAGDLLLAMQEPPADSLTFKALQAARSAAIKQARIDGKAARRQLKANAQNVNAIMELKGGKFPIFSRRELWDAFAPGRICKMGTLDPEYIDEKTGAVKKQVSFESGEIIALEADEISLNAYLLLSSIIGNSVDNVREEFVKDGRITFYVKGVLQAFTDDPRTLLDDQLNLDRKTAGVLYLENLFKPLQEFIGQTENGSRYSVFNYIGYDARTDTMTIQTPYIYKLWEATQGAYFARLKRIEERRRDNKKPLKADLKPLEMNYLFKNKAYTTDESILEIAIYITNVLLTAGNTGKPKKTEIAYKTIIANCSRLKQRLDEIAARPNTETLEDGKKRNNTAIYNTELRKIKRAFDVILDSDLCDATEIIDFIDIQPAKVNKAGRIELIAPTKRTIGEKITIIWSRKQEGDPS